ncbi:MAG TPA: copper resistance protein CopC [Vicinamibacterales bacterium]|nr:copper resistance protein CopC [Vicinamibacterales bacterium]
MHRQPGHGFRARARGWTIGRVLLAGFGAFMVLLGLAELLIARARFIEAEPAPGATLAAPPSRVQIRFDRALHRSSYATVSIVTEPGTIQPAPITRRLDLDDPARRTLEILLEAPPPRGLYSVRWHARTPALYFTPWSREGRFYFGVGVRVPPHLTSGEEWDEGSLNPGTGTDARTFVIVSGLICLTLGALLSWRTR